MKKKPILVMVLILLTAGVSLGFSAEIVTVISKENAIRSSCKFFAPIVAKVRYNDKLEVIRQEGDWYRVRFNDLEGCIHKTAVQKQQFKLVQLEGSGSGSATEDEVALAGKGFNPQVESEYKAKNPELQFHLVDEIEAFQVPENEQVEFIQEGELNIP
jgi:hypothetical protein